MLLLKKVERPRELKWYQAGAMLYGDWGTSKAYVLGIAFALSGHASWFFLGIMASLTALVGLCYIVVCRIYPDGGGVYSSVKSRSQNLAVIGAFLLIADYVVTASLSALDAFHYFSFARPEIWAIGAILLIGAMNWIGPGKGSQAAAVIALAASVTAGILFLSTLPNLPHVDLKMPTGGWPHNWSVFVGIVLALSGVEAVANMTGIMVEPVEKTSKQAIWPVLIEVAVLTFLLGIAMNAIPSLSRTEHTGDMLRALADHYIAPWYGNLISVVFGFLLLSATNTAITALVSIQFVMAKDRELPSGFAKLNRFGMPGIGLAVATLVPVVVLIFEHDIVGLAALYAIGVVGAVTLNLGTCATNFQVPLKKSERALLIFASVLLFFIELTICFQKHNALIFASTVLGVGLGLRFVTKKWLPVPVPVFVEGVSVLNLGEAKELASLYKSSLLLALKAPNSHLIEEVALRARTLKENSVYVSYVEEIPMTPELPDEIQPSEESLQVLAKAQQEMEEKGITAIPIWQMGSNPGKLLAQAAEELGVKSVLIGTTRKSALVNLLRGDVLRNLARNLPKDCRLIIAG